MQSGQETGGTGVSGSKGAVPSGRPFPEGDAVKKVKCFRANGRGKRMGDKKPTGPGTGVLGDLAESSVLRELGRPPEGKDRGNRRLGW